MSEGICRECGDDLDDRCQCSACEGAARAEYAEQLQIKDDAWLEQNNEHARKDAENARLREERQEAVHKFKTADGGRITAEARVKELEAILSTAHCIIDHTSGCAAFGDPPKACDCLVEDMVLCLEKGKKK